MNLLEKVVYKLYKFFIVFAAIIFFFSSCNTSQSNNSYPISSKEKKWMNKFFYDLMLEWGGIYTLWGSKPLTRIVLYQYSEEEIRTYQQSLSNKEKKNCRLIKYDLPENWEKWELVKKRFPLKRYLLFKQTESDVTFIYFLDILKTTIIIQENYEIFKREVGFDFDPPEIVLQIQNEDSLFWKKVKKNSALLGLLFGYGKENSWGFHWKYFQAGTKNPFAELPHSLSNEKSLCGKASINLQNFPIPSFASFDSGEIENQYKIEREKIRKIYRGRDFLKVTLEKLTQ